MTIASNIYGGSNIPVGDKLRTTGNVTLAATDTTILTLGAGNPGIIHGIFISTDFSSSTAKKDITNIKVTVDGAAERTLNGSFATINFLSGSSDNEAVHGFFIPLPIRFSDSIVVKSSVGNITAGDVRANLMYSVN